MLVYHTTPLHPVAKALDNCQSDKCGIADACHEWLNFWSDPVLQPNIKLVEKRFKQAVFDEHLVAYILHPTYRGAHIIEEQLGIVNRWIMSQEQSWIGFWKWTYVIPYELNCGEILE